MKIIHQANELQAGDRPVCAALGMFDGVHIGHQRVLTQTVTDAQTHGGIAVAVTFDQHPNAIVAPDRNPPLIYSLPHRLRRIEALGVDAVLLLHFDRAFSEQPGQTFATRLIRDFKKVASLCVGAGFTFGYKRSGTVRLLEELGREFQFQVHDLPPVSLQGLPVSSTRIRSAIREGELNLAGEMLGRPYSIEGQVVRGEQLGRQLGYPTANVDVKGLVLPPVGVYAGRAKVQGNLHAAVANIGYRPTLNRGATELRLEVHLLRFAEDVYGEPLEFTFGRKLRGEEKFASLDALREQIGRDVSAAESALQ